MAIVTVQLLSVYTALFAKEGGQLKGSVAEGYPIDDDGILSMKQKPFDVRGFFIGRDLVLNTMANHDKGLIEMSQCNFNLSDAAAPQNFSLCEKSGLGVVVSRSPHLTAADWIKMSDQQIDDYVRQMVKDGGKSKAIAGYYICDEPSSLAFPKLAVAVAAVRKYAPGKLSIINLYPNYATLWTLDQVKSQLGTRTYKEYIEKYIEIVKPDFVCYDNYMVEYSMDMVNKDRAFQYYTNLLDIREVAGKHSVPFWNIVSSNQIRPFTTIPSPANMAFQAYTSLAAGYSAVIWFTYAQLGYRYAPLDRNGHKTLVWRNLQEVNRQLSILGPIVKKLKSTGVYFTSGIANNTLPSLPGEHVQSVESDVPVMVGEFLSDKGNRYLMVVNLSLEKSGLLSIKTRIPDEMMWEVSTGDDEPYFTEIIDNRKRTEAKDAASWKPEQLELARKKGVWLTAGQGTLIKCCGAPIQNKTKQNNTLK